jgi:hypothetical protein
MLHNSPTVNPSTGGLGGGLHEFPCMGGHRRQSGAFFYRRIRPESNRDGRDEHGNTFGRLSRVLPPEFLEDEAQKATLTESTALRAWHQKQLGLTAQDATQLRQIAATHVAALKGLEEAASRIIEAQRSQFPGGRLASPNSLPPPPPGLAQLQKQRDDLTTAHVQGLQAALSAASFAKLDPWIKANFKQQGAKPGVPRPAPQGANQ